ncbi:MAG: hypothetical protein EOP38_00260 [Rubrivivax sp.]|nr:MAG: hypothetical protein EOP38_00260 [Rubrivivax sp.]
MNSVKAKENFPNSDINRRALILSAVASLTGWHRPANAAIKLEGVEIEESTVCSGHRLILNGAGVRKRGYFKANTVALYLPERLSVPESIYRLDGPRRLQLHLLRGFTSSTISRIFIADFKQYATDAEFKQLIDVVAGIGALYSTIKNVSTGDVVNVDWVPKEGIITSHNGKVLGEKPFTSELAYQIYLRMFIGKNVPEDLRNALLGLKKQNDDA